MPSKKRLEDLEYNVFKKNMDSGANSSENLIGIKDAGCLTTLAAIIVFVVVIVMMVGFMQIGRNAPALTCAAPGCSNRLKPGSNYCWLHSSSSGSRGSGGKSSSGSSPSGGGSVIGGSSGSSGSSSSGGTRNKIWGGEGSNRNKSNASSSGGSSE